MYPKFMGEIKDAEAVAQITNPYCGDTMKVYLKIKKDKKTGKEKIIDAKFQTMGCGAAIASSDVTCELARGKTIQQASEITKEKILKKLGGLPAAKVHCSLLGQDALHLAIKNYELKAKKIK